MPTRRIGGKVPPGDQRSSLDRLSAMLSEEDGERRKRIFRAIRQGLDDAPNPEPWIAAACTLRDRGTITPEAAIYLTDIFVEAIMPDAAYTDPELLATYQRIEAIERAHGLGEDESWLVGEGPPEWTALQAQWDARALAITADYLRTHGQVEMATLVVDEEVWDGCTAQGYFDVWGDNSESLPQ